MAYENLNKQSRAMNLNLINNLNILRRLSYPDIGTPDIDTGPDIDTNIGISIAFVL